MPDGTDIAVGYRYEDSDLSPAIASTVTKTSWPSTASAKPAWTCAAQGLDDTVEYADNDTSASHGPRPHYTDAADIEPVPSTRWCANDLDRLHRQPRELERFIDLANKRHVALATSTGDTDLGTERAG